MGHIIGVDGGATGTVAILTDEDGTILSTARGPASSYIAVGKEDARQALHDVVHEVLNKANRTLADCQVAVFGLAGLNHPADEVVYRTLIDPIGLGGEVYVENDVVIAWAAATAGEKGAVVIAGTGASAFGVNAKGERVKTLGWDYLLADQGSGYWIGLEGIRAAIKAWDGRLENTELMAAMIDHYQLEKTDDMLKLAYRDDFEKPIIAGFAKRVAQCANEGDAVAQDILQRAGNELGQAVCAVIKQLNMADETFVVGLVGGTFRAGPYLRSPFDRRIHELAPKATIEPSRYPSSIGAVIYAHYLNGSLNDKVLGELEETGTNTARWKT